MYNATAHFGRSVCEMGLILVLGAGLAGPHSLESSSMEGDAGSAIAVGHETRQDDMPSIAAAPDGSVWAVWLSFEGKRDDVAIRHYKDGTWHNLHWVPGTSGDSWLPQIAVDRFNRVWVVWSQQLEGNWDLFARRFDPTDSEWGPLVRLSSDPLPDVNPRIWSDGGGSAALVWQGFRENAEGLRGAASHIFLRLLDGQEWTRVIKVTAGDDNDWAPAAVIDGKGVIWVAYDTYRNGDFDVYLAQIRNGEVVNSLMPVATTSRFEARANLAVDTRDRIWVTWESGPLNWGKDNGRMLGDGQIGAPLGGFREPRIACFENGAWFRPEATLAEVFRPYNTYQPGVFSDGSGSVWVVAMERRTGGPTRDSVLFRKRSYPEYWRRRPDGYWGYWITRLEGGQWTEPEFLPHSKGRSSTRMSATLSSDGRLWMIWPTDNRELVYYHRPVRQQVYVGVAATPEGTKPPVLRKWRPEEKNPGPHHPAELRDLRRMSAYRTQIDGKDHRLWRGDLHRHTELSWDEGGANDGSLDDYYRYMLDVAALDFGANTEHQGGAWPYWWWYAQKMTDMYHVPGTYVGLFAHERSASYPHGHRNLLFSDRSKSRVIPYFMEDGVSLYAFPLSPEGDEPADEAALLVRNDTQLLFEEVRARHGITIPHTSGTGMGTSWDHDDPGPEVEPVVEIFQGVRGSYESVGAPYAVTEKEVEEDAALIRPHTGRVEDWVENLFRIRAEGMVSEAWAKGYKLGVIASSDHISTHLSYAMVYTDDTSREGILDAIRQRHTYGATDNIILEVRMGQHFMGDEFATDVPLPVLVRATGTGVIQRIDLLKDGEVAGTISPGQETVELEFPESDFDVEPHYYYVRLLQEDGMIAWSSPLFVNYK